MKTAIQWAESANIYGDKAGSAVAVTIAFYHAKGLATPIDICGERYWKFKVSKKESDKSISQNLYCFITIFFMANPLSTCADWCNRPGPDFTNHTLTRDSYLYYFVRHYKFNERFDNT